MSEAPETANDMPRLANLPGVEGELAPVPTCYRAVGFGIGILVLPRMRSQFGAEGCADRCHTAWWRYHLSLVERKPICVGGEVKLP